MNAPCPHCGVYSAFSLDDCCPRCYRKLIGNYTDDFETLRLQANAEAESLAEQISQLRTYVDGMYDETMSDLRSLLLDLRELTAA